MPLSRYLGARIVVVRRRISDGELAEALRAAGVEITEPEQGERPQSGTGQRTGTPSAATRAQTVSTDR